MYISLSVSETKDQAAVSKAAFVFQIIEYPRKPFPSTYPQLRLIILYFLQQLAIVCPVKKRAWVGFSSRRNVTVANNPIC